MPLASGPSLIAKAYLGATEVNRMYLGTVLVYEKAAAGAAPVNTNPPEIHIVE